MVEKDIEKANLTLVNGHVVDKSTGEVLYDTNSQICNFCKLPKNPIHLVYHPLEGNGVSYGCDDCVETVPEITKTDENKFYFFPRNVQKVEDFGTSELEEPGFDTEGMSLGQKLEAAFDIKFEIDAMEEKVKLLKSEYDFVQREILSEMADKDLDKIECSRGSASYKVEPFPNLKDHMQFFGWVAETKRFEFLEKRCSRSAIKDMLATEGVLPPGIDTYMKESISIRKKPVRRK